MIPFAKWHGIGNDFVLLDRFSTQLDERELPDLAVAMCDRRFGVGSDGLLLAEPGREARLRYRMFNPDGSESEMCGNGIRCFALFALERGLSDEAVFPVETGAGLLLLRVLEDNRVQVSMGVARLTRGEIPMTGPPSEQFVDQPISFGGVELRATAVSMGNPHIVLFVADVDEVPLNVWGPQLETHPLFPKKTNVQFAQVTGEASMKVRTWERGAGATLACGTGACAAAVASRVLGLTGPQVRVSLPGGDLDIAVGPDGSVVMTGPATKVFEGEWPR